MSSSNASSTNHRRSAAAIALLALLRPSQAFVHRAAPSVSTTTSSSSSLNFREPSTADFSFGLDTNSDTAASTTCASTETSTADAELVRSRLPTWLQTAPTTPAEVDAALSTLRDAMVSSYLTTSEAATVLNAIQSSAGQQQGDTTTSSSPAELAKMGGAAQFCHILVDTMEMGVTSLIAAIQHYRECYDVREHEARHGFSSGGTTLLPKVNCASLEMFEMAARAFASSEGNLYGSGSTLYPTSTPRSAENDEAARIASDASGLKRTEAVARTTFRTSRSRGNGNRQDAYANMQNLLLSETNDWRALAIRTAACTTAAIRTNTTCKGTFPTQLQFSSRLVRSRARGHFDTPTAIRNAA